MPEHRLGQLLREAEGASETVRAAALLRIARVRAVEDREDALRIFEQGVEAARSVMSGYGQVLMSLARWVAAAMFAWILAASIRVAIGSATVAALTAAGLVAPSMVNGAVSHELMVLAIGSGSIFFSHLNDAGFWMFKEFFQLSVKETFLSWTLMESCISLIGLAGVWIIYMFVG